MNNIKKRLKERFKNKERIIEYIIDLNRTSRHDSHCGKGGTWEQNIEECNFCGRKLLLCTDFECETCEDKICGKCLRKEYNMSRCKSCYNLKEEKKMINKEDPENPRYICEECEELETEEELEERLGDDQN